MSEAEKKRNGFIRNPLTVISVFAGLAEVSATIALPQLESDTQEMFVWFVMGFPILLVCLFFGTLWTRHHVLYAPSDFSNEDNFMSSFSKIPVDEYYEVEDDGDPFIELAEGTPKFEDDSGDFFALADNTPKFKAPTKRIMFSAAMNKALSTISERLGVPIQREVGLRGKGNFRFDGVAETKSGPVIIEVTASKSSNKLQHTLLSVERAFRETGVEIRRSELIYVLVYDPSEIDTNLDVIENRLRKVVEIYNPDFGFMLSTMPILSSNDEEPSE